MLVNKAVPLAILAAVLLWESRTEAASSAFKICGRKLGDIMSRVCDVYNSPSWDVPTVVEQPAAVVRRKRQVGIADECCTVGCTWEQLTSYCSISANTESTLEELQTHAIADRSVERVAVSSPAAVGGDVERGQREVGRVSRGYGRARRRCWCRRKRRSGRRRASLMGNMDLVKNVIRAAPVVGTVSPLLTWGRTLNTDLPPPPPPSDRERYAYVAVYST